MKQLIIILIIVWAIVFGLMAYIANAAPTSTILLRPIIPSLQSAGNPCLTIGATGLISTSTCGGGGANFATGTLGQVTVFSATNTGIGFPSLTFTTSTLVIGGAATTTITGDGATTIIGSTNLAIGVAASAVNSILFGGDSSQFIGYDGNINNGIGVNSLSSSSAFWITGQDANGSAYFSVIPLTINRTFTLPDKNGTFAMLSDLGGSATTTIIVGATTTNGPAFTFATTSPITAVASGTTITFGCATCITSAVTSANSITGAVNWLASGPGLSVASSGQNITYTFTSSSLGLGNLSVLNSPLPIANGGRATTSVPATNALMYFDGTTITGTSSVFYLASNPSSFISNISTTINTAAPLGGGGAFTNNTTLNLTCTGCLTAAITNFNGSTSSTINYNVVASGGATTSVATAGGNSTTTVTVGAGAYLGIDGSNRLTVSSTLATSSATFVFPDPTSTAPYSYIAVYVPTAMTATQMKCWDAVATSTVNLYYNTTLASTSVGTNVRTDIPCGAAGNTTTSFTTTTIPIGSYLFAHVTSTAGTPTQTTIYLETTKT